MATSPRNRMFNHNNNNNNKSGTKSLVATSNITSSNTKKQPVAAAAAGANNTAALASSTTTQHHKAKINEEFGDPSEKHKFYKHLKKAGIKKTLTIDEDWENSSTRSEVSALSISNASYILDLAQQKESRNKDREEMALEEALELYGTWLMEGKNDDKNIFLMILHEVKRELNDKSAEKDRHHDALLDKALEEELERRRKLAAQQDDDDDEDDDNDGDDESDESSPMHSRQARNYYGQDGTGQHGAEHPNDEAVEASLFPFTDVPLHEDRTVRMNNHDDANERPESLRMIVDMTPSSTTTFADAGRYDGSMHQSIASVDSTACTSTATRQRTPRKKKCKLAFTGSYRNWIIISVCFVIAVAALTVLALYFATLQDDDVNQNYDPIDSPWLAPTAAPHSGNLRPSLRPTAEPTTTIGPTSAPTPMIDTLSTSCNLPVQDTGVVTAQAENAPELFGPASISNENSGYCGEGYIANLTTPGSGFVFGSVEVNATGYYRVAVRYNNADFNDKPLRLLIDGHDEGIFELIPTGNETSWMVEGIGYVSLKEGNHAIEFSLDTDADQTIGPNIDWLTLSLQQEVPRFIFLVELLERLIDVASPSESQALAISWMTSEDPIDWTTLSNQEMIERYALVHTYFSLSGNLWINNNQWLSEFHACGWYGITCSKDMLVTDLMLDSNSLTGHLPKDLFLLTNLILISLDTNDLKGTIPGEIGNLDNLSQLFLHANFLSGELPPELGSLEELKTVDLRANFFHGSIPEKVYSMVQLENLALASNYLSGTLSTNIGSMQALRNLDLQSTRLSGTLPSELGELTLLTSLALGYNEFTGSVPGELGFLKNLSVLDINTNYLTGILPPELRFLNDTIIDYYGNDIV
mmetsp:Transcript_19451/g.40051  ORF Transcript_19451/g.40051 Transcript_19451/m.40051 type:complete len:869 (+) Transcript_19451:964-3570(+)